ncbi:MAG: hypothetical protein EP350_06520 [Alphaproteobacteria bacterium]|nr:MAG: hypothetical protein EP350_06520 [Alphaproteobacteria bacterium]
MQRSLYRGACGMKGLAATIEALESPVEVFFRDDDAGWADPELHALLDLFEDRGLPIDLAVIPAALGKVSARNLASRRECHGGIGLHQHGYAHLNYEPEERRKCEFGPSRPATSQIADVIAGRERLASLLEVIDPIFTPPWNRCSDELVDALGEHGFALFSADRSRRSRETPTAQLPVTFDWERHRREERLEAGLVEQFAKADGPIGIMLHHEAMDDAARAELGGALDVIAASSAISVRPMRHWIAKGRP